MQKVLEGEGRYRIQEAFPRFLRMCVRARWVVMGSSAEFLQAGGAVVKAKTSDGGTALYLVAHRERKREKPHPNPQASPSSRISALNPRPSPTRTPPVCAAGAGKIKAMKLLPDHGARFESPGIDTTMNSRAITQNSYTRCCSENAFGQRSCSKPHGHIQKHVNTLLHPHLLKSAQRVPDTTHQTAFRI